MENTRKPWSRALYLPVLAVGVALVAAVSSWAASPEPSTTPAQSPAPAAAQENVQDTQTTPSQPDGGARRDGPGGRGPGDCPEHDGDGGGDEGSGSGSAAPQSEAPDASQTSSEV